MFERDIISLKPVLNWANVCSGEHTFAQLRTGLRLIRDGDKGGGGVGGRDYIPLATLSPPEWLLH